MPAACRSRCRSDQPSPKAVLSPHPDGPDRSSDPARQDRGDDHERRDLYFFLAFFFVGETLGAALIEAFAETAAPR